jgi:hypothetical protein
MSNNILLLYAGLTAQPEADAEAMERTRQELRRKAEQASLVDSAEEVPEKELLDKRVPPADDNH